MVRTVCPSDLTFRSEAGSRIRAGDTNEIGRNSSWADKCGDCGLGIRACPKWAILRQISPRFSIRLVTRIASPFLFREVPR